MLILSKRRGCQKETRRKGFVLNALHGVWDVHHQQWLHRAARSQTTRAGHWLDAVQDLQRMFRHGKRLKQLQSPNGHLPKSGKVISTSAFWDDYVSNDPKWAEQSQCQSGALNSNTRGKHLLLPLKISHTATGFWVQPTWTAASGESPASISQSCPKPQRNSLKIQTQAVCYSLLPLRMLNAELLWKWSFSFFFVSIFNKKHVQHFQVTKTRAQNIPTSGRAPPAPSPRCCSGAGRPAPAAPRSCAWSTHPPTARGAAAVSTPHPVVFDGFWGVFFVKGNNKLQKKMWNMRSLDLCAAEWSKKQVIDILVKERESKWLGDRKLVHGLR